MEIKNTVTDMKNTCNNLIKLEVTEKRISELEVSQ